MFNKKVSPEQQKVIDNLRKVLGDQDFKKLERLVKEEMDKAPKVAIIGKAGVGKSTTINALFNLREKVSHVDHGTTVAKPQNIAMPDGGKLSVIDMPGLGSDIDLDKQYQEIYRQVLPTSDVVLYVMQANVRGIAEDQKILRDLVGNVMGNLKGRLVIGLNQVDQIGPGTWNTKFNRPSPEQEINIDRRCQAIQKEISSSLSIKVDQVEYYSASKCYRLYELLAAIIKSAGNVGWKFSINPSDWTDLISDPKVREFVRNELGEI